MTGQDVPDSGRCPQCEQPLNRWPTLEPGGFILICDECGFEDSESTNSDPEQPIASSSPPANLKRWQKLLQEQNQPDEWPEELLEELPDDARKLLKAKGGKADSVIPSDMEKRLKGYGYFLSEDSQGARLTGEGPKPGTGDLSPMDVVRLAAELEGGLSAEDERQQCPECQAVLPGGARQCQWCGHQLATPPK